MKQLGIFAIIDIDSYDATIIALRSYIGVQVKFTDRVRGKTILLINEMEYRKQIRLLNDIKLTRGVQEAEVIFSFRSSSNSTPDFNISSMDESADTQHWCPFLYVEH